MLKRNMKINPKKKKKGQSTIEYIILVATIIGALLLFLGNNSVFQTALNDTLSQGTNGMVNMAQRLAGSHEGR